MRSITLCPAGPRKPTRSVRTGAPIAGCRWRQSNGAAAALTGRVVQPSGISLRTSIRPLESDVTASGCRPSGGLDFRFGGGVVAEPAAEAGDVVPKVVVGPGVMLAAAATVVVVAAFSSEEVADTAPLGAITVNDPAVLMVIMMTTRASGRRRRSFRQFMASSGSILKHVAGRSGPAQRPDRPLDEGSEHSGRTSCMRGDRRTCPSVG